MLTRTFAGCRQHVHQLPYRFAGVIADTTFDPGFICMEG